MKFTKEQRRFIFSALEDCRNDYDIRDSNDVIDHLQSVLLQSKDEPMDKAEALKALGRVSAFLDKI